MSNSMTNVTLPFGPLGPQAGVDRPVAPAARTQGVIETAFLGCAFLVLQGAFIGMAVTGETG